MQELRVKGMRLLFKLLVFLGIVIAENIVILVVMHILNLVQFT